MGLIDILIWRNIDKRIKKSIRITEKIDGLEKEYVDMKIQLLNEGYPSSFINKYFENKIEKLKTKLDRNDKLLQKNYKKLEERNVIRIDDFFHDKF